MITKNMSPEEVANYVEEFVKRHISFDKRIKERTEITGVLPFITNKKIILLLQDEIQIINQEELNLDKEHQEIVQIIVEYIFKNKENKKLLEIKTAFFDEYLFGFEFIGQLGKPFESIMTLNSYFEFSGIGTREPKVPKEKNITNTMSYEKFISVLNEHYIAASQPLI